MDALDDDKRKCKVNVNLAIKNYENKSDAELQKELFIIRDKLNNLIKKQDGMPILHDFVRKGAYDNDFELSFHCVTPPIEPLRQIVYDFNCHVEALYLDQSSLKPVAGTFSGDKEYRGGGVHDSYQEDIPQELIDFFILDAIEMEYANKKNAFNLTFVDDRAILDGVEDDAKTVTIDIDQFQDGTPCLNLINNDTGEFWYSVTKKIMGGSTLPNVVYVPNYTEYEGLPELLIKNGIIKEQPLKNLSRTSGFVEIDAYELTDGFYDYYQEEIAKLRAEHEEREAEHVKTGMKNR